MTYRISQLKFGQKSTFTKTISESDVYLFAGVTGDFNPAHVNEIYASNTHFKTRIVHGMLAASLISTVIGTELPGRGSIYLSQELKFVAPVHFGDTITATVEIIEILLPQNRVRLHTSCTNQAGKLIIDGEALIMPPL